jgi:hypothetical protein
LESIPGLHKRLKIRALELIPGLLNRLQIRARHVRQNSEGRAGKSPALFSILPLLL